jgi:hypothetical protein
VSTRLRVSRSTLGLRSSSHSLRMAGIPWLGFQIPAHLFMQAHGDGGSPWNPKKSSQLILHLHISAPPAIVSPPYPHPATTTATATAAPEVVMSKRPNPTIQSYFPLVPKPITPPKNKRPPTPPPSSPWTPQSGKTYTTTKIGSIEAGPKRICFTGRIANFREQEKNSKKENAARLLIRMTIADETGVIDVSVTVL